MDHSDLWGRSYFVHDWVFSITDAWSAFKYLWLLPSKGLVNLIHCDTSVSRFLHIDCLTGASLGGYLLSGLAWFCGVCLLAAVIAKWRRNGEIPDRRNQ